MFPLAGIFRTLRPSTLKKRRGGGTLGGVVGARVRTVVLKLKGGRTMVVHPKDPRKGLLRRFVWLHNLRYFRIFYSAGDHVRTAKLLDADGKVIFTAHNHEGEFIVIAGPGAGERVPISVHGKRVADPSMSSEKWSGGFVDTTNEKGMQQWAKNMCSGLDVKKTAKELNVPPTISAVAQKLIGNPSDDPLMKEALVQVCERELEKTNRKT